MKNVNNKLDSFSTDFINAIPVLRICILTKIK